MNNIDVPEQINDIWRTRPSRIPHGGPFAGVAAGIARRYDVDPVLIRVAFVVSTLFGGAGLVLYLAVWALSNPAAELNETATEGAYAPRPSGSKWVLWIGLAVAASIFGSAGVGFGGSGLLSMAAMLGGLWLLHQRRPEPPPTYPQMYDAMTTTQFGSRPFQGAPAQGSPAQGSPAQGVSFTKPTVPPTWDPLGVAPFAWDLPEPGAAAPAKQPRKPKSRWTSTFIGIALLVAGGLTAVGAATGAEWLTPARIGAAALVVVAIGLVVGAFLRKGYGLLVVAGPLLGFVVLASLAGPLSLDGRGVDDLSARPATAADLLPTYSNNLGDVAIDLRGVQLTSDRHVDVRNRVGDITVTVPQNMNVSDTCSSRVGDVSCLPNGIQRGPDASNDFVLTLDVRNNLGNVTVRRG